MNDTSFECEVKRLVPMLHYEAYHIILPMIKGIYRLRYIEALEHSFCMPLAFQYVCESSKLPNKSYNRYLKFVFENLHGDNGKENMSITNDVFASIKKKATETNKPLAATLFIEEIKNELSLGLFASRAVLLVLKESGLVTIGNNKIQLTPKGVSTARVDI